MLVSVSMNSEVGTPGVDQRRPLAHRLRRVVEVDFNDPDLGDAVLGRGSSSGFEIDEGEAHGIGGVFPKMGGDGSFRKRH